MLSGTALRTIHTFNDAVDLLSGMGALPIEQVNKMTGFGILPGDQKKELLGVPFIIVQFEFKAGKLDSSFVDCHIVTTKDERFILRDSSRGIHEQLKQIKLERERASCPHRDLAVYVRKGLSGQENAYEAPDGTKSMSTTYYLNGIHYSIGRAG